MQKPDVRVECYAPLLQEEMKVSKSASAGASRPAGGGQTGLFLAPLPRIEALRERMSEEERKKWLAFACAFVNVIVTSSDPPARVP